MALLLFACFLLFFSGYTNADPLYNICEGGNYTAHSTFKSNLDVLLSSLSSSNSTFTTDYKGSIPNRAYGLLLCRGDVASSDCTTCIDNAAMDVLTLCPKAKRATVWYDNCQLRYGDLSFFSIVDNSNNFILYNVKDAADPEKFVKLETALLDKVVQQAAFKSSMLFATGIVSTGGKGKLYALAQCTWDLSPEGCGQCLGEIRQNYGNDLQVKQGGRVLVKSCNFRYEVYPFFAGNPTVSILDS